MKRRCFIRRIGLGSTGICAGYSLHAGSGAIPVNPDFSVSGIRDLNRYIES